MYVYACMHACIYVEARNRGNTPIQRVPPLTCPVGHVPQLLVAYFARRLAIVPRVVRRIRQDDALRGAHNE